MPATVVSYDINSIYLVAVVIYEMETILKRQNAIY